MKLVQSRDGQKLTITIEGELNTLTAPDLEKILGNNLADVDELVFDLTKMNYTSSAGLRAFLGAQQVMGAKGRKMIIRGASDFVMEIFEETGFDTLFTFDI